MKNLLHKVFVVVLKPPLLVMVLGGSTQTANAQKGASPAPTDLIGKWWGEARHGDEAAELGFSFEKKDDGRVLAREWLSNINAYGSAIGFLNYSDSKFVIPDAGVEFVPKGEALAGNALGQDLTFQLQRTDRDFPGEPEPPKVGTGPEPVWTYHGTDEFWASPVVDQDVIYIGDKKGIFHAVDLKTGGSKWTFDAHSPLLGSAAIANDAVYFAADDGHLFKLRTDNGAKIWQIDIGGASVKRAPFDFGTAAPTVHDNTLYIGSADGAFRSLDGASGKEHWSFKTNDKIRGATLVAADRVYFGGLDHFIYALERNTGKEIWRFDTGSPVTTKPILADGKIVIGTRDRALLFALDAEKGTPAWTVYHWFSWVESEPVVIDGLLYIGSSDSRRVRAIDPKDGHVLWAAQVWGWTWGTPLVVNDMVYYATGGTDKYFITQKGSLGALDRKSGAIRWRKPIPLTSPNHVSGYANSLAYADGKIIAAGLDGTIVALPTPQL